MRAANFRPSPLARADVRFDLIRNPSIEWLTNPDSYAQASLLEGCEYCFDLTSLSGLRIVIGSLCATSMAEVLKSPDQEGDAWPARPPTPIVKEAGKRKVYVRRC